MKIAVIGLGYVGYPLALLAKNKGFDVIGIDKNEKIVNTVNQGEHPIEEVFFNKYPERFSAVTILVSADVYIICVPTPVQKSKLPDLKYIIKAVEEISEVLENNQTVILESTVNPGVCDDIIKPVLDKTGKKYMLAHCPERINPGDKKWNISNIPRVVGGLDMRTSEYVKGIYEKIIDANVLALGSIKSAESVKILENSFRDINIAFINEMAKSFYRLGIDIVEVIEGAKTKPFAFMPHYPGIGVGGHCIAVDPYYMIEKGREAGFYHDFLTLARRINDEMPDFTLSVIQDGLNDIGLPVKNTVISVLGLSYKPEVADDRESPSYKVIELLKNKGAILRIFDPYFPEKSNCRNLQDALDGCQCAVLATAHSAFIKDLKVYKNIKLFIDGRNAVDKNKIKSLGLDYKGIGITE